MNQRVGIVVPTLGQRPGYLEQCLRSIRAAGEAHILLVVPESTDIRNLEAAGLVDSVETEIAEGLPAAINQGIESLPKSVEYVNWLGDDDLLTPIAFRACVDVLDTRREVVMTFGACDYIDRNGEVFWENRSGQWAVPLMRIGPDLIPQPGALFRRETFEKVGGLKTNLGWAFDFDIFIRFSKVGKLQYVNQTLAQFRWHAESLSVEHRQQSVAEASQVRVSHLPACIRTASVGWEYLVRQATLMGGKQVSAIAQSKARGS